MKTNAILHQVHVHIITEAANKKLRVKHGFGQHVTPQRLKKHLINNRVKTRQNIKKLGKCENPIKE